MERPELTEAAEEYLIAYEEVYCLSPYMRDLLKNRAVAIARVDDMDEVTIDHIERAAIQLRNEADADEGDFPTDISDERKTLEQIPAAYRDYSSSYFNTWGEKVTATGIDLSERMLDEDYRYALTHASEWPDPADSDDYNRSYSADDWDDYYAHKAKN